MSNKTNNARVTPSNKTKLPRLPVVTRELSEASGNIRGKAQNKINVLTNMRSKVTTAIKENQPLPVFNNLMPIVSSREVLILAYSNIKRNPGAMTPGTENQTADEFSNARLDSLSTRLKNNTYDFPDVRRTWVPKPGKSNSFWKKKENLVQSGRPLGLPDFDAKVVQSAINLVLINIYEPLFDSYNVSFGFHPERGCHDAVKDIPNKTQGLHTVIEGDIKGAFNCLQHDTLIQILSRRINDKHFLSLINKCCKAGIFDQLQQSRQDSVSGVSQGGIVSPTLWNIYMHEFDRYIRNDIGDLISSINKRQNRQNKNSKTYRRILDYRKRHLDNYKRITHSGSGATRIGNKTIHLPKGPHGNKLKALSPEYRQLALHHKSEARRYSLLLLQTPSKHPKDSPIRIFYVRYADDWILFANGKRTLATYLRNKIASFLKYQLGLTLSVEKTKITDLTKTPALFLSFSIYAFSNKKVSFTKYGTLKRITGKNSIGIDFGRLNLRLGWKGFLNSKNQPKEQPAWSVLTDFEIVERYNAIISGLVNYYCPIITSRSNINWFIYVYEYSCYKTLCQKHRTTIRKLLRKEGNPLTVTAEKHSNQRSISLFTTHTYWERLKPTVDLIATNLWKKYQIRDPNLLIDGKFLSYAKTYYRTAFKMSGRCAICGSKDKVEMHHERRIRGYDVKQQQGFLAIMGILNRKQVPLCKHHHVCVHNGTYDGISLSELYDTRVVQPESFMNLNY
jgi:retron-type reverse transcriptase